MTDSYLSPDRYAGVFTFLRGPSGLPLTKPPYGRITAIDLNTGEHAWMIPHGEGPRMHPLLAPLNLPRLGWNRFGFVLLTRTLLFGSQTGAPDRDPSRARPPGRQNL
jgi:glucose dehydrogenase